MFSTHQKNRFRRLMNLMEQKSTENYIQEFESSNYQNLKELLENDEELLKKMKEYTLLDSVDEIENFLTKPNKTKLMRIMFESKQKKDIDVYNLVDAFFKTAQSFY